MTTSKPSLLIPNFNKSQICDHHAIIIRIVALTSLIVSFIVSYFKNKLALIEPLKNLLFRFYQGCIIIEEIFIYTISLYPLLNYSEEKQNKMKTAIFIYFKHPLITAGLLYFSPRLASWWIDYHSNQNAKATEEMSAQALQII